VGQITSQSDGQTGLNGDSNDIVPTIATSTQPSFGPDEMTHTASEMQGSHQVMETLARETGGLAFYNANNLSTAIDRAVSDGTSYYTLGYYPQNKDWDGKFRRVVIHANRKDLKLRAREGYYAFDGSTFAGSGDTRLQQERARELQMVIKDPLPDTGVTFRARVLPSPNSPSQLQVEFLVDAGSVSFKEVDQSRQDSNLDFAAFAVTHDGRLFDTVVQNVDTPLPPTAYDRIREQGLPFHLEIKSPPADGRLHLAVRDNRTGLLGTLTVQIPSKDRPVAHNASEPK
jgi:hypothetical protein